MNYTSREVQLNELANAVPPEFHRDDGKGARYYVYAWFHGPTCVYVGKGSALRWLLFYVSKDYNKHAHAFIKQHAHELEPFFVASNITETAAFAIEYHLIGHFRRREVPHEDGPGGTLFNRHRGRWPICPGSDRPMMIAERRLANPLVIPPKTKPLSGDGHWWETLALPDFPDQARMRLLNGVNPWRPSQPNAKNPKTGHPFYEHVLRNNPDSTIGKVVQLGIDCPDVRNVSTAAAAQAHLKWLFSWGSAWGFPFLEVDGETWTQQWT